MQNLELISVIVPVYNVEKYIRECLDSIVNQTYKNLQIILVDDGSTDNSGKICDEFAKKDSRITVVHQENQGAGAAKNTGLELIEGEYFSIIDSDDYIDLSMYEKMVSLMKQYDSDIVQCLFKQVYVNKIIMRQYSTLKKSCTVLTRQKYLQHFLSDWKFAIFATKIFKTSLLGGVRFPVGRKIDDEFFTYKLVCNAKRIVNTTEPFYIYRMRKSSGMNNNAKNRLIYDRIDCFVERYEYVSSRFPKLRKTYYNKLSDSLLFYRSQLTDVSEELNALIKKYPYKQPGILIKVFNKFSKKKGTERFEENKNLILFE